MMSPVYSQSVHCTPASVGNQVDTGNWNGCSYQKKIASTEKSKLLLRFSYKIILIFLLFLLWPFLFGTFLHVGVSLSVCTYSVYQYILGASCQRARVKTHDTSRRLNGGNLGFVERYWIHPFRTTAPFRGQATQVPSNLSPIVPETRLQSYKRVQQPHHFLNGRFEISSILFGLV